MLRASRSRRRSACRRSANRRLRQELPEHLADMALFSVPTGLRQANVKDLEWQYVDIDRMHLWIPGSKHKNGKPHSVPLNEMALSVLRKLQGRHPTRVFTFRGEPVVQVSTLAWRKALERAVIADFRWHDLRHTFATWHRQAGTDSRAATARRLEDRRHGGALRARGTRGPARCGATTRRVRQLRNGDATKANGPDLTSEPFALLLNFGGP